LDTQTNGKNRNFKRELMISSGALSYDIEKDRKIMGYATFSGSSQAAAGLQKLNIVDRTKQVISNESFTDPVTEESSTNSKVLRELNVAD